MTYTEEQQEIMNSAELCKQRDAYIQHIQALQSVLLSATSFDIAAEKRKMKAKHSAWFVLLLVFSIFSAIITVLCLFAKLLSTLLFSTETAESNAITDIFRKCERALPFAAIAAIILFTVYIVLATIRKRKINEKIKKPVEDNQRILATAGKSLAEDTEKLMNFEASMRNECVIPEKYWRYGFQIGNRIRDRASTSLTEAIQYFEQLDLQNQYIQQVQMQGDVVCPKCHKQSVILQSETVPGSGMGCGMIALLVLLLFIPVIGWIALIALLCSSGSSVATYGICKNCGYHYRHH